MIVQLAFNLIKHIQSAKISTTTSKQEQEQEQEQDEEQDIFRRKKPNAQIKQSAKL